MMITEKGQVTIPVDIREQFGFLPHTEIDFSIDKKRGKVFLVRKDSPFKKLKGLAKGKFTTEEIMKLTRG
jgi:antitoxin PrlF